MRFDQANRALDFRKLPAYTTIMRSSSPTPCLCNALRQASRAVSRLYDEELRARCDLRTTQFSLLCVLARVGETRQRDLGDLALLEDTTLTRNLRPLVAAGWIVIRTGQDRREKLISLTAAGRAKLEECRPAWEQAQARLQQLIPADVWQSLLTTLPVLTRLVAGS